MNENYLSPKQTLQMKSILCMIVVFSHCFTGVLGHVGTSAVAVFFFLSGYILSLTTKDKKIDYKIIVHKFSNFTVPYLVAAVLYHILFYFHPTVNKYNSLPELIKLYILFDPTVQVGWFVEALFVLFVFYFLARVISRGNIKIFFIVWSCLHLCFAVYIIFYLKTYFMTQWFIIGVIYALYKKPIEKKIASIKGIDTIALLIILISLVSIMLAGMSHGAMFIFFKLFASNLAPITALYISSKKEFNCKPLMFIGKYSLWIYLFHVGVQVVMFDTFLKGARVHSLILFLLTFVLSLVFSVVVDVVYTAVLSIIKANKRA
ncbi:MAG: acyltransferase [Saccharofermentans sp.]|nr:acyltransferase [Saccharofermentans sp.]